MAIVGTPVSSPDPSGPLPLSTKWPSVLLRENNISCNHDEVPEQWERNRQCEWHRVTNTLNSDNRKLMQEEQLKAQHIAGGTLKLTLLSRWHMLILWLWPQFNSWFSASGCPPMLLAHWPHKDRPCRYWSCTVNTNVSGLHFPKPDQIAMWCQQLMLWNYPHLKHSLDLPVNSLCPSVIFFSVGSDSIWFLAWVASGI